MINVDPVPDGRKAGSLTWAGLYNTYYWIDPATRVAGVIMMQILPFADSRRSRSIASSSAAFAARCGRPEGHGEPQSGCAALILL